jgi:hypothetical protein
MNTSLNHIVAQLRIDEMRQAAERARRASNPETAREPWAFRALARAWAARDRDRVSATGMSIAGRPGAPQASRPGAPPVPSPRTSCRADGS